MATGGKTAVYAGSNTKMPLAQDGHEVAMKEFGHCPVLRYSPFRTVLFGNRKEYGMFTSFFWSRQYALRAYLGACLLIGFIVLQVYTAKWFNWWNGFFFDVLQHAAKRPVSELWAGVGYFAAIAAADVLLASGLLYAVRRYTLSWRTAITDQYEVRWRKCRRHIEGASQRIQQDPQELAMIVEGIGMGCVRSGITLIMFIPILLLLNHNHMPIGFLHWDWSLVTVAIICSVAGMGLSWIVGIKLPGLEYNNQRAEAAFRKQLVLAEDHRPSLDLNDGAHTLYRAVLANYQRLYLHYGYFDVWSRMYAKIMMLLPYLLCVPYLHSGAVSLAVLMQVVHAFGEVQGGFSLVINNWKSMTKLQSVIKRLREFEEALDDDGPETYPAPNVIPLPVRRGYAWEVSAVASRSMKKDPPLI